MTILEAYTLVANLDFDESKRRYSPQHGLLHFNNEGRVVSVYRYDKFPTEKEQSAALSKNPGCLQISTKPDWYDSPESLLKRIQKDMWLFQRMKKHD